jgi:tRNA G46 methylase TrmB
MNDTGTLIDMAYDALEGCEDMMRYHYEHGTPSLQILTQFDPRQAMETVKTFADEIKDKRVIEIGAGVGFLAIEMAKIAKSVFAIESDPAWSWIFTHSLYRHKPKNLTWIFGSAETVSEWLNGDVAIIVTRSGIEEMREVAYKMAPVVLMPGLDEIYL